MTESELLKIAEHYKMLTTIDNAVKNLEGLRLSITQTGCELEKLKNQILKKSANGIVLTEDNKHVKSAITSGVNKIFSSLKQVVQSLNGIGKPGVDPMGIQLDLFDDVLPDHSLEEAIYDPARRVPHRSGMIQVPETKQLKEAV